MSIKDLTPEQLEWLKENFCHTKNQELADELGTSPRSVIRMARTLGLWKTSEFVAAMQQNAADHAVRTNRANGGNAGTVNLLTYGKAYRFKPGVNHKARMGDDVYREMHCRIGRSRREIYRKEKLRVLFGLEQKTRLRVIQCTREKICLRSNLRKHGYEIARASNEAFITTTTHRSEVMEHRAISMGISFTSI